MMKENLINAAPALSPQGQAKGVVAKPEGGRVEPPVRPEGGKALPPNPAPALPEQDVSREDLAGVVESLNNYLQSVQRELQFSVDDVSGRTIITVMDRENQEVIRQIPPESVLALAGTLREDGGLGSVGVAEKA